MRLRTDRGVFSADRIDPGTKMLLTEGPPIAESVTDGDSGDRAPVVLADVGCGYGAIAVTLALRAGPAATVWAIDVNERARDLCQANAEANGVADQVRVVAPTEVPAGLTVDHVWSNPPIRVGKAALHELLTTWLDVLRPGTGTAALVVHKHLGSDSLARWLTAGGWPTERLTSRAGYRILTVGPRTSGELGGRAEAIASEFPPTASGMDRGGPS